MRASPGDREVRLHHLPAGPKGVLEICKILGLGATELERVIGPRVEAAVFELNARRVTNGVEIGQLV
jgi:hypothetical protein